VNEQAVDQQWLPVMLITNKMHLSVYDAFKSQFSQQHVSAASCCHLQGVIIKRIQSYHMVRCVATPQQLKIIIYCYKNIKLL